MQAAVFAPFFQAVIPINSTPTSSRRTAITTDSSISVVPRWRTCLFEVLRKFNFVWVHFARSATVCVPFLTLQGLGVRNAGHSFTAMVSMRVKSAKSNLGISRPLWRARFPGCPSGARNHPEISITSRANRLAQTSRSHFAVVLLRPQGLIVLTRSR